VAGAGLGDAAIAVGGEAEPGGGDAVVGAGLSAAGCPWHPDRAATLATSSPEKTFSRILITNPIDHCSHFISDRAARGD